MSVSERNLISALKNLLPGEKVDNLINNALAEAEKNVQAGLVKLFEEAIWEAIAEKQNPPEYSENVLQSLPAEKSTSSTQSLVYMYCLTLKEARAWIQTTQLVSIENDHGFVDCAVWGDFCIVFSYVSRPVFGEDVLEAKMQDMTWLEEKVTAHQSVIESVMNKYPVVPMKFCTIFNSTDRIQEVVHENYDEFLRILDLVKGCQEWGLKVFYDSGKLQKYLENCDSKVKELKEKAGSSNTGTAYLIKKKFNESIDAEVEAAAFKYAEEFHGEMKKLAQRYTVNKLLGKEVTNRSEDMILNAAYLVSDEDVETLKEYVANTEARYESCGLVFSLTGPWPPYNFTGFEGGAHKDA